MINLTEEDSKRITSLRFLLIVFVVFIHNNLTADDAINSYHLAFSEPLFITWVKLTITRCYGGGAVPLFFLFSGYLQFCKQDKYGILLKKRLKTLVIPYFAWTLITVFFYFMGETIPQTIQFFQNEENLIKNWSYLDWLNIFWRHYDTNLAQPLVLQFWFIRDLFILILFSPILSLIAKRFPFVTITVILLCYMIGLPMGFGTALFFYMLGYFFASYNISFFKFTDNITWIELIGFITFTSFVYLYEPFTLFGFGEIVSCLFFLKLSKLIVERERVYKVVAYLSGFSFFLYALHTPILGTTLNKLSYKIIPLHGAWCLIQFIVPCLLCIIIGTGIGIFIKRFLPHLFNLLNGSR